MRPSVGVVVAVAGSLFVAACSNDSGNPLRVTGPGVRSADVIPSSCSITTISQDASNYLPKKDPGFNSVTALKNDLRASGGVVNEKTTGDVFAILKRVAAIRLTNSAGTAAQGAALVDAALACTTFAANIPGTFNALSSLASGIFAVTPTNAHVEAFLNATGANPVVASPRWGAEPGNGTWPSSPSGDFLVYGYPAVGTDASNGFELGTLPDGVVNSTSTLANPMTVAICSPTTVVQNGKPSAANLLVHKDHDVLSLQHVTFCSQSATADLSRSWLALLKDKVTSYFTPSLAWAQDGADLFTTGGPSGWSPFHTQLFTASNVTLAFSEQPVNTQTSGPDITVQVTASAVDNTGVPPQNVVLTIDGNHGTPAFLTVGGQAVSSLTAPTVANGDGTATATFVFGFTKAGGYTLSATGFLGGGVVATAPVLSVLFQVQNK